MLPTPKDIQALRTRTDDVVLEKLDLQVDQLQATHDTVKDALDAAKATYDEVDAELRVARAQRDAFRQGVLDRRKASLARHVPNLPAEVLANCFEQFCWAGDPFEMSFGLEAHPSTDLARAPFTVAAVCRRWRAIALATSALWCYVGLPELPASGSAAAAASIAYVLTVLERSGSFPLAIFIDWKTMPGIDKRSDCTAILDAIASQAMRWWRLSLIVSSIRSDWIDIFRNPTPMLRVLNCAVHDASRHWRNGSTRYLPVTPKLELLRLSRCPVVPCGPLPLLKTAYLWMTDPPATVVWKLLSRAPRLECLLLDAADSVKVTDFTPSVLSLPALTQVYLRAACVPFLSAHSAHLRCPGLTALNCSASQLVVLEHFLSEHGGSITDFTVYQGAVGAQAVTTLRLLPKATALKFNKCKLASEFWDALVGEEDALPLLTALCFCAVELDPEHDGLALFVRARRSAPASNGTGMARLQSVEFEKVGALPSWFVAEIKYIMAEKVQPRIQFGRGRSTDQPTSQ